MSWGWGRTRSSAAIMRCLAGHAGTRKPWRDGLLLHLVDRLLPDGLVVIGIDDTIERRWGAKIKARGIYRDPVRSFEGYFVGDYGLRWLSARRWWC